jgi:hypothetical protein
MRFYPTQAACTQATSLAVEVTGLVFMQCFTYDVLNSVPIVGPEVLMEPTGFRGEVRLTQLQFDIVATVEDCTQVRGWREGGRCADVWCVAVWMLCMEKVVPQVAAAAAEADVRSLAGGAAVPICRLLADYADAAVMLVLQRPCCIPSLRLLSLVPCQAAHMLSCWCMVLPPCCRSC